MITARDARLIRVAGLRALHGAIARRLPRGSTLDGRDAAVVVASRAGAAQLRLTLERRLLFEDASPDAPRPVAPSPVLVLPDLVTRDELYDRLHERLPDPPSRLSGFEREVLVRQAADEALAAGVVPPFALRPGLVAEMLALYDALRRRHRTIDAFDRLMTGSLEASATFDRGARRLLQQTRFLTHVFHAYEARVVRSGRLDEHALRARLQSVAPRRPLKHVIVAVAEQSVDPRGLWPADFDLLTRLPGLERIDVVATEAMLATGFHERLHELLPGIEEDRDPAGAGAGADPALIAPAGSDDPVHFVARDREEELSACLGRVLTDSASRAPDLARVGIVFQRPLPYLYLAKRLFDRASVPFQAQDALPLAAEPSAAFVDVVIECVTSGFTRSALVALLRSPHLSRPGGVTEHEIAALDVRLRERDFLGGSDRLLKLLEATGGAAGAAVPDEVTGLTSRVVQELRPLEREGAFSGHLAHLLAFLTAHERLPEGPARIVARHARARAAVLSGLDALRQAHATHGDPIGMLDELAPLVRRWIEGQTFDPRAGRTGVHLLDADAARYADLDAAHVVGLVEGEWPPPSDRNIFYPASLLQQVGWPRDADRVAGGRAAFADLLRLPARAVSVSTFTLDADALVRASTLLEELESADLAIERPASRVGAIGRDAWLQHGAQGEVALPGESGQWLAIRRRATGGSARPGRVGPIRSGRAHAVTAVEQYLQCPFKFFAARVLGLDEEADELPGLSPMARGRLVHEVFHRFYARWRGEGRGAISVDRLDAARAMFESVTDDVVASLPEPDRSLERRRLLGSAVAAGLGERAFRFEAERDVDVVERLLEHDVSGTYDFGDAAPRELPIRGVVDRVDLLDDGTIRVLDYKTGRAPRREAAVQLPVYGRCLEQRLRGHRGRDWIVGEAGYLAFGEPGAFAPVVRTPADRAAVWRDRGAAFLGAIDGIEEGAFPVRPLEPFRCRFCPYPSVCRKDYVGDE